MLNQDLFTQQSLQYQATHKKFMFTRNKIGSRADRVYSYYSNSNDWRTDKYLRISQEADNKTLQSREGRKLNLGDYNKKMRPVPLKK